MFSSRGSFQSGEQTSIPFVSCIGRWILYHCATRESPSSHRWRLLMSDYKWPKCLRPVCNTRDRLRHSMKPGTKFPFMHHRFLRINTRLTHLQGIQQIVVECINKCNILSCVCVSWTPACNSFKRINKKQVWISLVVQWLRLQAPCRGPGFDP